MLPWLLCAHMLGDYWRPFKQPVDEIIRASWAMYWHHKHCALCCPLRLIMLVIFFFLKSLVKVRPASGNHGLTSVTAVQCRREFIWRFKRDNTCNLNVTCSAKSFLIFFFTLVFASYSAVWVVFETHFTRDTHRTGAVRSIQAYLSCVSCMKVASCPGKILIVNCLLLEAHLIFKRVQNNDNAVFCTIVL